MWIYLVVISLSVFLFCLCGKNNIYKKKNSEINGSIFLFSKTLLGIWLASIPPMFISAVRYNVGTDYFDTYYTGFYRILNESKFDNFEIGYLLLNKIIQLFTDNVFVLFIITSILFVSFTYASIYELSYCIPISILMFFFTRYYFIGMNGVRQFIAISIATYSLKYVLKKDLKRFLLYIILACSFHYSTILFAPVWFLNNLKINKKRLVVLICIDILLFVFGIEIIIDILSRTKYANLLIRYNVCGLTFTIFTILLNGLILTISYTNFKSRVNDGKYRLFLNIQIVCFLVTLVLRSIPLMERIYWIYSFPIIVTFPWLVHGIKSSQIRRICIFTVLFIFALYMVYDIFIMHDHEVIPYQWIFGKNPIAYSGWGW